LNTDWIVLHIPHSSTVIPTENRGALILKDKALDDQILRMTDHYTAELFDLPGTGITQVVYPVSRLVADPERFLDDALEPMAAKGMGVIYENTADLESLRPKPTAEERVALLDHYYRPHHERFIEAVDNALSKSAQCLVIDCHSFPERPLPFEDDQNHDRPDICIGTDEFHTTEFLAREAGRVFENAGFSLAFNRPFAGSIVPIKHYRKTPEVKSIMIEINRKLYMDEATGERLPVFSEFSRTFQNCLVRLANSSQGPADIRPTGIQEANNGYPDKGRTMDSGSGHAITRWKSEV
jgi:N-formylglutamate deformylase